MTVEEKEMTSIGDLTPEQVIEEMKRWGGNDDYVPLTLRLEKSMFDDIESFCEVTGVKKAVLLRRLVELGWSFIKAQSAEEEKKK